LITYSEIKKIDVDNLYGPKKIFKKKETLWLLENKNWPTLVGTVGVDSS
jgi:hypothetical protein